MSIMMAAVCTAASAVVTQKIYLKNGSVLSGFIANQYSGGNLEVSTDEAVICMDAADVSVTEVTRNESALSKEWRKWAKDNDALMGYGSDKSFTLSTVRVAAPDSVAEPDLLDFEGRLVDEQRSFADVRILERGSKVRFLQLAPDTYSLNWSDVDRIEGIRSVKNALSGLSRTYTLKSGRIVTGQYAGETLETVSVFKADGTVETMQYGDIKSLRLNAVNLNQDINEQSPLTDVVTLSNNRVPKRGIIVEQYNDAENGYVRLRYANGREEKIMVSNISSIGKEKNPAYAPKFDVILKPGEFLVNRKAAAFVAVAEDGDELVLDSIPADVIRIKASGNVATFDVEFNGDARAEQFKIVTLTKKEVKKILGKKTDRYFFTYKDIARSGYQSTKEETSMNGTRKVTFSVPADAMYVLYFATSNRVIPVFAEK